MHSEQQAKGQSELHSQSNQLLLLMQSLLLQEQPTVTWLFIAHPMVTAEPLTSPGCRLKLFQAQASEFARHTPQPSCCHSKSTDSLH